LIRSGSTAVETSHSVKRLQRTKRYSRIDPPIFIRTTAGMSKLHNEGVSLLVNRLFLAYENLSSIIARIR
jgi:hypothetical protein